MKKFLMVISLVVLVLSIVPQVMAQSYGMYYETFNERTNQLLSKHWTSNDNLRSRMEHSNSNDFTITVFDPTTTTITMYSFDARTKTYTRFTVSSEGYGLGNNMQTHQVRSETDLGQEMVEGRMCNRRRINFANGSVSEYWNDPTLNDLAIRTKHGNEPPSIIRNIRQGSQPAHLFEIPRDYREQSAPDMQWIQDLQNLNPFGN